MPTENYLEAITGLPPEKKSMVDGMLTEIANRVSAIRAEKAMIEAMRVESGIKAAEDLIERIREEVRPIAKQFRELVGMNWQDDLGYCRVTSPGESQKYDVEKVDQGKATIQAMHGELVKLHDDSMPPLILIDGEPFKLGAESVGVLMVAIGDNKANLESVLRQLITENAKLKEETNLRLDAIQGGISKIAEGRSVKTTPSQLQIV